MSVNAVALRHGIHDAPLTRNKTETIMSEYQIFDKDIVLNDPMFDEDSTIAKTNCQKYVDTFLKSFDEDRRFSKMDFTPSSLKEIDKLIKRTWGSGSPSEEGMLDSILVFGGYVGRVLENEFKGIWWHNGEESVFLLVNGDNNLVFSFHPYAWAHKRLSEGDGESLYEKYRLISKMAEPYANR